MTRFFLERLPHLYERHIIDAGKQPQFFVLVAFLVTFLLARALTHSIRSGRKVRFVRSMRAGETHVHHLVPGIILLLIAGYLGIALRSDHIEFVAVLFGIGAALTLDEFALWLHLRDVYWEREGRRSIDAVIVVGTVLGISLIGSDFFLGVARELAGG